MRGNNLWGVMALLGGIGLLAGTLAAQPAQPPKPAPPTAKDSLAEGIARTTKLKEDDVQKVLDALGPAVLAKIASGEDVTFPGMGTIRIVRIPEHKDMNKEGRPIVVPAVNTVEFLPTTEIKDAANAKGVAPAETVPKQEFNVFPNQTKTPGQYVPPTRNQGQRVRPGGGGGQ